MDLMMMILSMVFRVDDEINNWNRNKITNDNIVVEEDIVYHGTQAIDLFYDPNIEGKYPVVFNIHGGGWISGDKRFRSGVCMKYAEHGFFVINANYSLSPGNKFPTNVRDLFHVFDFIKENKDKYYLDMDRIYISGDSAGGHLSCLIASIIDKPLVMAKMGIEDPHIKIRKAVLYCGVYDYDRCVNKIGAAGLVKDMTGYDYMEYKYNFPYYKELSPVNYVDENFPPTYMVSAPLDILCDGQAEILERKFKEVGTKYIHYIPEDKLATHDFQLNLTRDDSNEAVNGAIKFLLED